MSRGSSNNNNRLCGAKRFILRWAFNGNDDTSARLQQMVEGIIINKKFKRDRDREKEREKKNEDIHQSESADKNRIFKRRAKSRP